MLNMEYARLVDLERRRVADARIERERVLHDAAVAQPSEGPGTDRRGRAARSSVGYRGAPGPAR
jgi:hypothetical protein